MEALYWIWLSQCFHVGDHLAAALGQAMGGAEAVYRTKPEDFPEVAGLHPNHLAVLGKKDLSSARRVLEQCRALGIGILTWQDPDYPQRLRHIYNPPVVLYYLGDVSLLNQPVSIGVVGSRSSSDYGINTAGVLAYQLALQGIVVVSGCAVGGDSRAHHGALRAGGMTIGVEACGLDVNYPTQNTKLRRAIARKGLLLSELEPGHPVNKHYFSVRNRLISGLSDGVVIVEAPQRSGCLLTARSTLEQSRDLFCVPPRDIFSRQYSGVVGLLRDGAKPVFGVEDILNEYRERLEGADLRIPTPPAGSRPVEPVSAAKEKARPASPLAQQPDADLQKALPPLSGIPLKVYQSLNGVMQANELAELTGEDAGKVNAALTELELDDLVRNLGGGRYEKR